MHYPNFYTEVVHDKLTVRETVKLGFTTTTKTKPLIIDQLRASMRKEELELNNKVTIREMLTYIVTESGAMQADSTCFDDCVMSLALAAHIVSECWEPIEVNDNYYIEMI